MHLLEVDNEVELGLLQEADADGLFALAERNRSELERWLPEWSDATSSVEGCRVVVRHALQRHAVSGTHVCSIRHRSHLVGAVGLTISEPWRAEIGYWLASDHWGKGIMTRSVRSLLEYGFQAQHLAEVVIRCDEGNARAWALPERLGFRRGATAASASSHPPKRLYNLAFADWAAGG